MAEINRESEEEIIRQIQEGNIDAYKILVDRYADEIANLCFRYLSDATAAEDATQDVFLKAYRALEHWEPRAKFKTWLYRIAINHCINIIRRKNLVPFTPLEGTTHHNPGNPVTAQHPSGQPSAEARAIEQERRQLIYRTIMELPENQRQVIILYYYQNLSYKEMAEILNVSVSSIESRLFRAKKNLAKKLEKLKDRL